MANDCGMPVVAPTPMGVGASGNVGMGGNYG